MGKKPWIIAGSILGVLIIAYLGAAAFFMSHFLVNTSINGKDFSGKTVADVETYLKEQVADYELTVLEQNNVSDVITGSEISLAYKDNSQVQDALEQQSQLLLGGGGHLCFLGGKGLRPARLGRGGRVHHRRGAQGADPGRGVELHPTVNTV